MATENVEIQLARGWNDGKGDGEICWIVYLDGDKSKPWMGQDIDEMLAFTKARLQQD